MIILSIILAATQIFAAQNQQDLCPYYSQQIDSDGILPLCKYTLNNCRKCNNDVCLVCLDGFYLNSLKQCQSCKEVFGKSVATCDSNQQTNYVHIISCASGYYLDQGSRQCLTCGDSCQKCVDIYTCQQCKNDYFLSNYECIRCQSNGVPNCCQQDTFNICKICKQSFYLDQSNNCVQCINNCLNCSAANTCDKCKKGYFYDLNKNQCVQNPQNCDQACTTINQSPNYLKCVNCVSDYQGTNMYYPDSQGNCQRCTLVNCKICSNQNQCQECLKGYTLMTYSINRITYQQCYSCQTNCSRCQMVGSIKVCYECTDGSQPVNGSCLKQLTFNWNVIQSQSSYFLDALNTILLTILITLTL
ncbi:hypothetical protein ABPG74_022379 [Tetrahymena malaccensis]